MTCLKCGCQDCVRNGIVHNRQRYRCKACGYNYTSTKPRGYPEHMKQQALQLYLEGMGFRAIGRVLEISNVINLAFKYISMHTTSHGKYRCKKTQFRSSAA